MPAAAMGASAPAGPRPGPPGSSGVNLAVAPQCGSSSACGVTGSRWQACIMMRGMGSRSRVEGKSCDLGRLRTASCDDVEHCRLGTTVFVLYLATKRSGSVSRRIHLVFGHLSRRGLYLVINDL